MIEEEQQLSQEAIDYIKQKSVVSDIIHKLADPRKYPLDENPISIFMAGSPGAGKTEFSKRLVEEFEGQMVRIDADDVRELLPQFTGNNSEVVQGASALGVEKLYDFALKNKQNLILDGTMADYDKALNNIDRSLKRGRAVEIFYLYQDPPIAWDFTQKREKLEKRNIPKEMFTKAFLLARENVNKLKEYYKKDLKLNLVIKNYKNDDEEIRLDIDNVDAFLPVNYNERELNRLIL